MRHFLTLAVLLSVCACSRDDAASNAQLGDNLQPPVSETQSETGGAGGPAATNAANGTASVPGGPPASAPPVADGELSWNASTTSRGHKLSYGRPQTDDVRTVLRCAPPGQVTVQVFPPKRNERPPQMSVTSGGASERVRADVTESMLGGLVVAGNLRRDSDVLRNFRNGQPLSVSWASHSVTAPAKSAQISTFFERCG